MSTLGFLPRLLLRLRRDERGFSMLETVAALVIIFVALASLAYTVSAGMSDVAFARQRQAANAIASKLIEDIRGLPYDSVKKGLSSSDLTGDSNILYCSAQAAYYFKACPATDPNAEKLVHTPGLASVAPLVPHRGSFAPPTYPTTYNWSTYVTRVANGPRAGAYRVIAMVSWANPQRRGVSSTVHVQTFVYSPKGCVDTATHPYSAPCQPYFYGVGSVEQGSALTTGLVAGLVFDAFVADLAVQTSDIQAEQVNRVHGSLTLPGARSIIAGVETTVGRTTATTNADDDPSSATGRYATGSLGGQSGGSVSTTDGISELGIWLSGGERGSTTSTTAASSSQPCTSQTDGQLCGYAEMEPNGETWQWLTIPDAGTADLVYVKNQSNKTTTYARRIVPTPGAVGTFRETVTRHFPDIEVGGLPDQISAPSGWGGYWVKLSGYAATAKAEAGIAAPSPTVTVSGGQIQAWNGTGYTATTVTAAGGSVPITPVSYSTTTGSGVPIEVAISGSVDVDPSTTSESFVSGSTTDRADAEARLGGPLQVTMSYSITTSGAPLAMLTIVIDLGGVTAHATFTPAPS